MVVNSRPTRLTMECGEAEAFDSVRDLTQPKLGGFHNINFRLLAQGPACTPQTAANPDHGDMD